MEESVYKLIEPEKPVPEKPRRYKSKHPSDLPPTASTFCLKTTSKPGIGNLNGEYKPGGSNHTQGAMGATFGKKKGELKPETTQFLKKQTGTMKLPESRCGAVIAEKKFEYDPSFKKETIPKQADKPIMGLVSDKNFIVANAVENILAGRPSPKACSPQDARTE